LKRQVLIDPERPAEVSSLLVGKQAVSVRVHDISGGVPRTGPQLLARIGCLTISAFDRIANLAARPFR
jgi:hypothetical protein